MLRLLRAAAAVLALCASSLWAAPPGITLVGKGLVPGDLLDKSGLTGNYCQAGAPANCVSKAVFGGFGSDLTYTGHNSVFIAAPDRGPFDGLTDVPYLDRFHFLYIATDLKTGTIETKLLDTRFLRDKSGKIYVGAAGDFKQRFDPEGIRVGPFGTFYISDEYGPYIKEFNRWGYLVRNIKVPKKFAIANPSGDPTAELLGNTSGRQANRGMEGLAITPNGATLIGIMQNALLQDNALTPGTTDRVGLNNRILKVDLWSGTTREYVYVLEAFNRGQGVSEILAVNDHQFLVIERDNRSNLQNPPQAPSRKKIYLIDLDGATDVSGIDSLPATGLPAGVTPVKKTLFIDLLDPTFNLVPTIAEKIEGLAWGPRLKDGRHLLYVISDNDLTPSLATQIYAFAVDEKASGVDVQRQFLPFPLYSPLLLRWQLGHDCDD